MNRYHYRGKWIIWLSILIGIIIQLIPWPPKLYFFHPSWLNLLLIYWVMTSPHQINIGLGFISGLILDLIFCSTLGIRALALSILVYLVKLKLQFFCHISRWQQVLFVILLSLTTKMIVFLAEFFINNRLFRFEILCNSMVDGLLWPWLFLLMEKICRN